MEIYAQVLKRRDREQIGRAFDHLLVGGAHGDSPTTFRVGVADLGHEISEVVQAAAPSPQDTQATGPQFRLKRTNEAETTGPKPPKPQ